MSPTEIRPAIDRLLMLIAGPVDEDTQPSIEAALHAFDDEVSITELACSVAVRVADRLPPGPAALPMVSFAHLVAFGMVAHAADLGRQDLDEHLSHLDLPQRAIVVGCLLGYWRGLCFRDAHEVLATITVDDLIEGATS